MTPETSTAPRQSLTFRLFGVFQRLVAIACLAAGLYYWALLIGLRGGELWRFDLMPAHWQSAATSLAVIYPVAAVGLWMPVSWGPVLWFCAAFIEAAMYLGFPELFGREPLIPALHLAGGVSYLSFRIILNMEKRRARRPVRVDSL